MQNDGILVVEDDDDLRDHVLVPGLRARGFEQVSSAASALEAYRTMLSKPFSAFVLDVGLPDEDGFEVARHVRTAGEAGIVMLTGWRKSSPDQVAGLDNGADAYLTKPVDLDLLAATVRSVLRRKSGGTSGGNPSPEPTWSLSPDSWFLSTSDGARISLTRIERAFLQLLFANIGRVVSREAIIVTLEREGKGEDIDFDPHRIELLVHRLRKKTAKLAGKAVPLNTVRGTGYALTAQ